MADIHGDPRDAAQMPDAAGAGPAPVPYGGARQGAEPPLYDPGPLQVVDYAGSVLHATPMGNAVQQDRAAAYGITAADLGVSATPDAPYYPGPLGPVNAAGDRDAGGMDDVCGDVAGAVAAAQARWGELQGDLGTTGTPGPGALPVHAGTIGDLVQFPPSALDPGAGVGTTLPTAAFYDPPRDYGGNQSVTTGYIGNEPPPGFQGEAQ